MKKNQILQIVYIVAILLCYRITFSQNVGINMQTPLGKLHVKGSSNVSQLIIDANATQSNSNPLIRLRKSEGSNLMSIHADDSTNCFVGLKAGISNNAAAMALNNTFIGNQAGFLNSTGHDNTAVGSQALYSNTRLSQNTAIGKGALGTQSFDPGFDVSTGNVAIGNAALLSNQPTNAANGVGNSAVGWSALRFNTTGLNNSAFGFGSLYSNTTASKNTAIGMDALRYNTTAGTNTAVGMNAMYSNTTASANTVVGQNALSAQSFSPGFSWSSWNVAVGVEALAGNQPTDIGNGMSNTAVGSFAMHINATGFNNVAVGKDALVTQTTGSHNTACGVEALYFNTSGSENVAVGFNAGVASYLPNGFNTISIGNSGYLNGASNQAFMGNLSTNWTGGNTTWFTYASDGRVKNNVKEDVMGLDFISRLRPVTYNLDITAMRIITGNAETADYPEKYDVEKIKQSGFIAQEVEQAANASGYLFSGYTTPKKGNELYTMSYEQFVVPLVKAVQEQQSMIEVLNSKLEEIHQTNQTLLQRIEALESRE